MHTPISGNEEGFDELCYVVKRSYQKDMEKEDLRYLIGRLSEK